MTLPRGVLACARRVARRHLGRPPLAVHPLGGGLRNTVIAIDDRDGRFVLHLGRGRAKHAAFAKERWAMTLAHGQVPTPRVLDAGRLDGWAYLWSQRADGQPGDHSPDRQRTLRALGRCAARLHEIRGEGFGARFDLGSGRLRTERTWRAYLAQELQVEARLAILRRADVLDAQVLSAIPRALHARALAHQRPVLVHGDLRLKNVVVDAKGEIRVLIDWELAAFNLPHWDLSIALHDLTIDEKEAFLTGYGMTQIPAMARAMTALNLLHYAGLMPRRRLAPRERERLRLRLSGALDLFRW